MGFFNIIITMGVGAVMLFGAALTYKHRMAEMEEHSLARVVEKPAKDAGYRAPLPKWDDKNYKGLNHR
jgi:hypothetical protein